MKSPVAVSNTALVRICAAIEQFELGAAGPSPEAETDVANGFTTEALFQFSQDVELGDLFEFVVQGRLEHADVENAFTQSDRRRVRGNKFADNFRPRVDHFSLVQPLA